MEFSLAGNFTVLFRIPHFCIIPYYALTSTAPSELLRIDREDFQVVLQAYSKKDWDQRIGCLNWLPAFADWTPQEKQNCTQDTKVRMYKPNQVNTAN